MKLIFKNPKTFSSGFTLIELLVVIVIIGVVFGVVVSSSAQLQKQARDTQRKNDLRTIQNALQMYYADKNYYPTTIYTDIKDGTNRSYLVPTPKDPSNSSSYGYSPLGSFSGGACSPNCHFYYLCATLENSSGSTNCGGSYNYEVSPLK